MSDARTVEGPSISRLGLGLLAALIALSALAIGALAIEVLSAICVGFGACVAILWWDARRVFALRSSATTLLIAGVGLTAFTLLQRIPLPLPVLARVASKNADVWARALTPLRESGPAWAPVTLDPNATSVQVARGVVYILCLLCCLRLTRRAEGVALLERTLVVTSVIVAITPLAHPALGLHKVFGIYAPRTGVGLVAPLLNGNQLGGYINIGLLIGLASTFSSQPILPRAVLAAIVAVLAAVQVWLAGRGAVATMVLGMVMVVVLSRAKVLGSTRLRTWAISGALALAGIGVILFAGFENVAQGLTDRDVSKLDVVATSLKTMLPAYPLFGAGRGAFESTFPEFRKGSGFLVFSHPENFVAQWMTEWGAPVALAGFAAIAFALRPRSLFARARPPVGPWCAVAVVVLHNLVDFSLEVPGIVIALIACAACVVGGTGGEAKDPGPGWTHRLVAIGGGAAAFGAVALTLTARGHELLDDQQGLFESAGAPVTTPETFRALTRAALLAHPAEPYFPYIAAARATRDASSPLPWIERTLERSPIYPPSHLLLARWLRRRSPSHARVEYRIFAEQNAFGPPPAGELLPMVTSFDDAMELVPEGRRGVPVLVSLASAVGSSLPATQVQLDEETALRAPSQPRPIVHDAARALKDLLEDQAAPWCAKDAPACLRSALQTARKAQEAAPGCETTAIFARVLALAGEAKRAVESLAAATDSAQDRGPCLQELAALAISTKDDQTATTAIEKLARMPCDSSTTCVANLLSAAQLEGTRGNANRALVFLRRAAAADPDREDVVEQLATQAARAGLHTEALAAWEKLAARRPEDSRFRRGADQERVAQEAIRTPR
jgi:hypothetical protein